jgi:hypothetical protein
MEKKKILTYFVALATVVYIGVPLTYAQTEVTCNPDTLKPVSYGQRSTAVKNVQACLIQAGYDIPAGATGYYGKQTVNAVKQFYAEWYGAWSGYNIGPKGIEKLKTVVAKGEEVGAPTTPSIQALQAILKALGLTDQQIAAIMAIVSGTTAPTATPTQPTTGVEGTMVVEKDPSVPAGQTLREGETQDILALRITAQSSDITVKSFRLVWPIASTWGTYINSVAPTRAITEFQVVDDQGNVLQTIPASSFSQEASTLDYYYYVTGLNYVVPKGTYRTLKVRGTAVGTFPSGLANGNIVLAVAQNDVRGVDQAGVDRFGPSSAITNYVTAQTSVSVSAKFVVSRSADTPLERYVFADTVTQRIDKEPLLYFTLQAKNDKLKLLQLTASSTPSDVTTLYLYEGKGTSGRLLGSVAATTSGATFTNLPEVYVNKDEVKDFTIAADFASVDASPATTYVSILSVQSQNSLGDTTSTTVTGVLSNPVYSLTVGPQLSLASVSKTYNPPTEVSKSSLTSNFSINVTPKGGALNVSSTDAFALELQNSNGDTATVYQPATATLVVDLTSGKATTTVVLAGNTLLTFATSVTNATSTVTSTVTINVGSNSLTLTPAVTLNYGQSGSNSATGNIRLPVQNSLIAVNTYATTTQSGGSTSATSSTSNIPLSTNIFSVVYEVYQGATKILPTNNLYSLSENQTYNVKLTAVYNNIATGVSGINRIRVDSFKWNDKTTDFIRNSYYTDWVNIQ